MDNIKGRFNEKYKISPKAFGDAPMPVVEKALKYIPHGKALELGVGNGRNTLFLLSKHFQVTGVDLSDEGIKLVKQRSGNNPNLKLVIKNVLEFETEEKFDIVLAIGLLHFLTIDEIKALINKMDKWTAKNGINVIATRMVQNLRNDLPHIFAPDELRNLYTKENWKIEEYNEVVRGERKIAILIARKLN